MLRLQLFHLLDRDFLNTCRHPLGFSWLVMRFPFVSNSNRFSFFRANPLDPNFLISSYYILISSIEENEIISRLSRMNFPSLIPWIFLSSIILSWDSQFHNFKFLSPSKLHTAILHNPSLSFLISLPLLSLRRGIFS